MNKCENCKYCQEFVELDYEMTPQKSYFYCDYDRKHVKAVVPSWEACHNFCDREVVKDNCDNKIAPLCKPQFNLSDTTIIRKALFNARAFATPELQNRIDLMVYELLRAEMEVKNDIQKTNRERS